jgi:hypothetical protein
MALKFTIEKLVDVPGPIRDYYKQTNDGKFVLDVEAHPDSAKLSEFRDKNISLLKDAAKYEGIDPDAVKADRLKLVELETLLKARPDATALESQLAAEKAAHASTQLKQAVTTEFLRVGGRASAVDWMAEQASKVFAMQDGNVTTKEFSVADPASPLSIAEWMTKQIAVSDFAFQPSRGGGAAPSNTKFGVRANQKVLKNPTAQELGANASAIASGEIKVEHS